MKELQYDSFYKFLVSLGVTLVALPIIAIVFLMNNEILLITQNDYENLSCFTLHSIQNKEQLYNIIYTYFPPIAIALAIIGILLVSIGSYKWYKIQKMLDEQVESDTAIKKINAKKMNATEIALKAVEEAEETANNQSPKEDNNSINNSPQQQNKNQVLEYMHIEDLCYRRALRIYSKKYKLDKNIRVRDYCYDFIAISKKDNIDLLFEVKYWRNIPPSHVLSNTFNRLCEAGKNYKNTNFRDFKSILMIVTPDINIEKTKNYITRKLTNMQLDCAVEIDYISEEELNQNNKKS